MESSLLVNPGKTNPAKATVNALRIGIVTLSFYKGRATGFYNSDGFDLLQERRIA